MASHGTEGDNHLPPEQDRQQIEALLRKVSPQKDRRGGFALGSSSLTHEQAFTELKRIMVATINRRGSLKKPITELPETEAKSFKTLLSYVAGGAPVDQATGIIVDYIRDTSERYKQQEAFDATASKAQKRSNPAWVLTEDERNALGLPLYKDFAYRRHISVMALTLSTAFDALADKKLDDFLNQRGVNKFAVLSPALTEEQKKLVISLLHTQDEHTIDPSYVIKNVLDYLQDCLQTNLENVTAHIIDDPDNPSATSRHSPSQLGKVKPLTEDEKEELSRVLKVVINAPKIPSEDVATKLDERFTIFAKRRFPRIPALNLDYNVIPIIDEFKAGALTLDIATNWVANFFEEQFNRIGQASYDPAPMLSGETKAEIYRTVTEIKSDISIDAATAVNWIATIYDRYIEENPAMRDQSSPIVTAVIDRYINALLDYSNDIDTTAEYIIAHFEKHLAGSRRTTGRDSPPSPPGY